tara:strand:+ start:236 stop:499 length:264 start_codon:yes stop_codon:yes gene_type:complete
MHPESPPASNNKTECYQLDINLLAKAHSMTHSRGDGRISVADITELLNDDYSNPAKVETILYLYKTMNFTDAARKYLLKAIKFEIHE